MIEATVKCTHVQHLFPALFHFFTDRKLIGKPVGALGLSQIPVFDYQATVAQKMDTIAAIAIIKSPPDFTIFDKELRVTFECFIRLFPAFHANLIAFSNNVEKHRGCCCGVSDFPTPNELRD